jgi:cytochrome c oxidase assembly protein Cox11
MPIVFIVDMKSEQQAMTDVTIVSLLYELTVLHIEVQEKQNNLSSHRS